MLIDIPLFTCLFAYMFVCPPTYLRNHTTELCRRTYLQCDKKNTIIHITGRRRLENYRDEDGPLNLESRMTAAAAAHDEALCCEAEHEKARIVAQTSSADHVFDVHHLRLLLLRFLQQRTIRSADEIARHNRRLKIYIL